ncbi:MAG: DUF86 domain-containing protein [Flavobacteriales bacterium]|nr:DUF86 domain-containing protein [Flavobacteriales bacterium]
MMGPSAKFWSDILTAIGEVESFLEGVGSLNEYVRDLKTKRAVERELAVIGEAVNRLRKEEPGLQLDCARSIVGMRNRLIHSYANVDDKIVWEVVQIDLPMLRVIAEERLGE